MKNKLCVACLIILAIVVLSILISFLIKGTEFTEEEAVAKLFSSKVFKDNKLDLLDFPDKQGTKSTIVSMDGNQVNVQFETIINKQSNIKEYIIRLNEDWLEGNEENMCSWTFFVRPREVVLVEKKGASPLLPQ
jgi:hypothetical protein